MSAVEMKVFESQLEGLSFAEQLYVMEVWKGDKNEEELFKAAHTLKGVGLNLALSNINQYVLPITENYRPKNSVKVDNVEELFDKLEKEYNISVMKIREFAKSQQ